MSDESATAAAAPTPERCLYLIHCLDDISGEMIEKGTRFGGSAKRLGVYLEHRAYLATTNDPASPNYIKKVAAGPMESEDQKYMIGSFFIVESTREEAEAFNRNDPFRINNVWDKVCSHFHLHCFTVFSQNDIFWYDFR